MRNFILCYLFFILCFSISPTRAQEYLQQSSNDNMRDKGQLAKMEDRFNLWASDKDLDNEKGWKWYGRWLNEQIKRSNLEGELPDQTSLLEAAIRIVDEKHATANFRTESNWMPIGPQNIPETPGDRLFPGMGRINTITFHPTDKDTFWVGVAQGGVWKTTNSGKSWMPLTDDLPILRISDIAIDPNNTDVMYISVGDYAYLGIALETTESKRNTHYGLGVYKSVNGGESWEPTGLTFDQQAKDASLTRRVFVNPDNSNELVAAGIHGVWRSHDAGDNWEAVTDRMVSDFEMDPTNPNVLYMSTAYVASLSQGYAAIWKSTDFGDTWVELNADIPTSGQAQRIELSVSPADNSYVYALACGTDGGLFGLYRTTNAGQDWELMMNDVNILHWSEGNSTGGQGNYDLALLADPLDRDKVYGGGVNMWGSEDGGKTWQGVSYWRPTYGNSLHADHHYYAYNPLDQMFYACHDGGVNRTSDIVMTPWEEILNNPGSQWKTVWEDISGGMQITSFYRLGINPDATSVVIAGAQDNSTFVKNGDTWFNVVLGDGMEGFINIHDPSIMFTSTQGGALYRSTNSGENFSSNLAANIRQQESGEWTTPFVPHPSDPNTIFAGFGNIWESNNMGTSWTKKSNLDGIPGSGFIASASTMTVSPSDPSTIYLGKRIYPTFNESGEFWATNDGGTTMKNVSSGLPTSLYFTSSTVNDRNAQIVWVTMGGFSEGQKVFRSDAGGGGWNNVSDNLPNVPVNVIRHQPFSTNNTVYIGTDLGVYYINDDLEDWQLFSTNLPNVIVTDLEIDPVNDKIYASTFGRGIWMSDLAEGFDTELGVELTERLTANIYPNPNAGSFKLIIESKEATQSQILIVDIRGTVVYEEDIDTWQGVLQRDMDLDLNYGLYFMRISNGNKGKVIKFSVE